MKTIKFELLDDNGFNQPLYYDTEYGESPTSYFTLIPDESANPIIINAAEGGRHSRGIPQEVINREAYRFEVNAAISRSGLNSIANPDSKFTALIAQLLDEHFAENFEACDEIGSQIDQLLKYVDAEYPSEAETVWHDYVEEVGGVVHIKTPDLPVVSITHATPDHELAKIANTMEQSEVWRSRENFVLDSTYTFLVAIRDNLTEFEHLNE
ncbi:MAG: hypothetical protein AAGC78_06435 [Cellvibrio sp.]|uniref:hypothetical protein n=1 Tax=Cellvibrio sp. TaxID=1965322 RepID=UPI00319F9CA6